MDINLLLKQSSEMYSDFYFIEKCNEKITFKEFYRRVIIRSEWFKEQKLGENSLVFISERDPVQTLIAIFSTWVIHATIMIINPLLPKTLQQELIAKSSPYCIVSNGAFCISAVL